jgi:hypothetical protein
MRAGSAVPEGTFRVGKVDRILTVRVQSSQ